MVARRAASVFDDSDLRRSRRGPHVGLLGAAELIAERISLVNRVAAILATSGVRDYNPLLRSCRRRLDELRTPLGSILPPHARAKIMRIIGRLEMV